MAQLTIGFGAALILLGLAGYLGTEGTSLTALIPAVFGLILLILGMIARNPNRRKLAMHIAVVVGVLGFAGAFRGLLSLPRLVAGDEVARPAAVGAQSIMALLMLVYVVLCFKSFVDARRKRPAR